jgi:hypothetical protein
VPSQRHSSPDPPESQVEVITVHSQTQFSLSDPCLALSFPTSPTALSRKFKTSCRLSSSPLSQLSPRTPSCDCQGTQSAYLPGSLRVQMLPSAWPWTSPSQSAPANASRPEAAGWVASLCCSLGSDEHSLRPSTIKQIQCGSNKSPRKSSAQIKPSTLSEGCWRCSPQMPHCFFKIAPASPFCYFYCTIMH